ncbi:putative phage tail protein [Sporosarcina sp. ITBMC105]
MLPNITTEVGRDMFNSVTPIYNNDDTSLAIFEANGRAMQEINDVIVNLKREMYPQNATWTVGFWEDLLGIDNSSENLTIEQRVHKILFEINKYFPITRNRMRSIVNSYVPDRSAEVREVNRKYRFHIILPAGTPLKKAVFEAVEDTKPAHQKAIYYIKLNGKLHLLDSEKMSIAPVVRFLPDNGKGLAIQKQLPVVLLTQNGTHKAIPSSGLRAGPFNVTPSIGRVEVSDVLAEVANQSGLGIFGKIAMKTEQKSYSQNAAMGLGIVERKGSHRPNACGTIRSGGVS